MKKRKSPKGFFAFLGVLFVIITLYKLILNFMLSIKNLSRLTGATYLLMVPFGVLGILYIPNVILVPSDMVMTIENIKGNLSMFHLSIFSSLLVQLIQIILVLLLYKLLSHASKTAGILMIAFIVPAVSIAMLNEVSLLAISSLVSGAVFTATFTAEQIQGLVGLLFDMHQSGVMVAQIFWGLWLFPMGYLVYKSGYIPRFIGVFLMIGCFGYLADSLFFILNKDVGSTVSEYTFLGEVLLPLWLIIKAKEIAKKHPESKI